MPYFRKPLQALIHILYMIAPSILRVNEGRGDSSMGCQVWLLCSDCLTKRGNGFFQHCSDCFVWWQTPVQKTEKYDKSHIRLNMTSACLSLIGCCYHQTLAPLFFWSLMSYIKLRWCYSWSYFFWTVSYDQGIQIWLEALHQCGCSIQQHSASQVS